MIVVASQTGVRAPVNGSGGRIPFRLTVEQYHEMMERGIIREGEPYELIDGQIVRKDRSAAGENPMTIGHHHILIVSRLGDLSPKLKRLGCYMRTQQPLTLPPFDEPEPDGVIALGTAEDYAERDLTAEDVLCVIEVADSSLQSDRTVKQQIYADSGIPQYVIINLPEQAVEVYTQPLVGRGRYGHSVTLTGRDKVRFPAPGGKELLIAANRLLPPR